MMMERRIYELLRDRKEYVSTKTLAALLDVSDRNLRAHGKEIGLLDRASRWAFENYGKIIVCRMSAPSGVRLSDEPEEIERAKKQWETFHWRIAERVKHYDTALVVIRRRKKIGLKRITFEQMHLGI